MRRAQSQSKRPILLSLLALGLALVACVGALWSWINYIPGPSSSMVDAPASPAYAAAVKAGREYYEAEFLHQLESPSQREFLLECMYRVLREADTMRAEEWKAPRHAARRPLRMRTVDHGAIWTFRSVVTETSERRSARGEGNEAREVLLDGMSLVALLSRGADHSSRRLLIRLHSLFFHKWEELSADASVVSTPREALKLARLINGAWENVADTSRLEAAWDLESYRGWLLDLAQKPVSERYRRLKLLGRDSSWNGLRALCMPRSTSLMAVAGIHLEQEEQLRRTPHQRRAPLCELDPLAWIFFRHAPYYESPAYLMAQQVQFTDLALLEVSLGAEQFRRQHGRYPAQLEEMVPKLLPTIPLDQWNTPVIYRLKDGKPLLYSLGADGKDDGGRPFSIHMQGNPDARGDRVFGVWKE